MARETFSTPTLTPDIPEKPTKDTYAQRVEALEASNKALRAQNEALMARIEALGSANEGLSAFNDEMQVNSQQIGALNQSLNSILENIAIPLLVVDRGLYVTNLSRVGEAFFGISPLAALPHISGCNFPEGLPDVVELLDQALETGQKVERVVDKADMNATLTIVPNFAEGSNLIGAIILVADNTNELKALLEELSRSNEELNRFSYVCSHDMKEPVRMIENMTQLLLDPVTQSDGARRDEILMRINTNMARLRGIIDSLLAYSRVDAKVEVASVDLGAVVDEVLEALALSIEEKQTIVTRGPMPSVRGARVHFVQLFQNLVGNALKHSDAQDPEIRISSVSRRGIIVLRVEDNGQGIPKRSRKQIFELFGRLRRRDETEGTGLGLSICKKITAQYGGEITCHDSALGGALFEIAIPMAKVG